jgi:hypothetical protein
MLHDGPTLEVINDGGEVEVIQGALIPVKHAPLIVAEEHYPVSTAVFNPNTVARVVSVAATAGSTAGGFMAHLYSPHVAQAASDAVREAIKKKGKEFSDEILASTGLDKIPGSRVFIDSGLSDAAHAAGEATYQSVKREMTTRGAALGGAAAGITAIALMEGANFLGWSYQQLRDRQEYNARSEEYRQLASANLSVDTVDMKEDEDYQEVVVFKGPVVS